MVSGDDGDDDDDDDEIQCDNAHRLVHASVVGFKCDFDSCDMENAGNISNLFAQAQGTFFQGAI